MAIQESRVVARRPRATPLDKVIGERIKTQRLMLRLSQSDLAERLGCSFQQVQKYENGSNRVSAATLSRISDVLNLPLSYFFDQSSPELQQVTALPLDREGADLLRAFAAIGDAKVRRHLLDLVKSLAAAEE
jgi:transcriptional regulator with XRE-family HTH domain